MLSNTDEISTASFQGRETSRGFEWFAIQVKCRYEERIASILIDKGFEALSATSHPDSKTSKSAYKSRALFPGYIFGRFDVRYRMPILVTPGVQAIVGYGKVPIPVNADEIAAVRQVLESGEPVEPCSYLEIGDSVEVVKGPLSGMRGILLQHRSSYRVVLSVSLIQRSVRVQVPQNAVIPINTVRHPFFPERSRTDLVISSRAS